MKEISEGFKPIYKGVPPFMKYTKGFGYYGVLLESEEDGKLQCHLCGETADNIAKHIFHKHKDYTPSSYKVETGLNLHTPLMSEKTRKLFKNNFLNLTDEKRDEIIERLRNNNYKISNKKKLKRKDKASIEMNNRYGTCPEQVRSQFYEVYKKLNRLPTLAELSGRLRYIIETRFGTYEEAVVAWGIPRSEYKEHIENSKIKAIQVREKNDFFPKYTENEVYEKYFNFFKMKDRLPTWGEVEMYGLPGRVPFKRVFNCNKRQVLEMFKQK